MQQRRKPIQIRKFTIRHTQRKQFRICRKRIIFFSVVKRYSIEFFEIYVGSPVEI